MIVLQRIQEGWRSLVERTGLENRHTFTGIVGSNPTLRKRTPLTNEVSGVFFWTLEKACFRMRDKRKSRRQLDSWNSSGMIQKTQLAAALVARPHVLLLDEPFRGLDSEATVAALELLRDFEQRGGVLIIASHSSHLLEQICSDVMDLDLQSD